MGYTSALPGVAAAMFLESDFLVQAQGGGIILPDLQPGIPGTQGFYMLQGMLGQCAADAFVPVVWMDCYICYQVVPLVLKQLRNERKVSDNAMILFPNKTLQWV